LETPLLGGERRLQTVPLGLDRPVGVAPERDLAETKGPMTPTNAPAMIATIATVDDDEPVEGAAATSSAITDRVTSAVLRRSCLRRVVGATRRLGQVYAKSAWQVLADGARLGVIRHGRPEASGQNA